MQKCFYHAKIDAVTTCLGCKMPVCGACRDAGSKGFCDACIKKVAALGEQFTDLKKTGMVASTHKATMLKSHSRPTSQKNVTYCFQHFDVVAAGTCPTCTRAFCQECLDASGMCTHCARHAGPPPAVPARKSGGTGGLPRTAPERPAAATAERPRPARPTPAASPPAPAAALLAPSTFFVIAIVVFLLIVAYKLVI